MPLTELERAGFMALTNDHLAVWQAKLARLRADLDEEGQHPDYYIRVRKEVEFASGRVLGIKDAQHIFMSNT